MRREKQHVCAGDICTKYVLIIFLIYMKIDDITCIIL